MFLDPNLLESLEISETPWGLLITLWSGKTFKSTVGYPALPTPLSATPQYQLHPFCELLKEFIEASRLGRQGWVETGRAGPTGSLFMFQLTMGRLGQVVEDKQCIQLKDLTSVSHGHAGPREREGGTLCSGPSVWNGVALGWGDETRRLRGTLSSCRSGLQSVLGARERGALPS